MSAIRTFQTTIDSDMGPLMIVATYYVYSGQKGDWHTEPLEPRIEIDDVKVTQYAGGEQYETFLYHLSNEIEEYLEDA